MDQYNILVLMEKDSETGYLTQTIDSYKVDAGIELVENAYLAGEADEYFVYLTLTTPEVEDYQYYGIYDLYDEEIFKSFGIELLDGSGEYNPRWILKLKYSDDRHEMERLINELVEIHKAELQRIAPMVEAGKDRYMAEANDQD